MSTTTTDATSTTSSAKPSTTKTFRDFGVDPTICDSLAEIGITEPFPIQEMTLPLALNGADIIGQARTGTGKTLGFGLPMLQRVDLDGGLQVLVIVPTRELCLQVTEDLAQAGTGRGVDVLAVYGGKAIQPQIDSLADGVHVVVGTPGRLLDLSRRGVMDLSKVNGLVLDEADEMLDLGFLPDVEALVEMCADERQTLLFSATMPAAIVSLARRYMTKPTFMRAEVEEITIAPQTKQYFFSCHRMDKPAVLARILQTPDRGLCVVFCRTKRMADTLAEELRNRDLSAQAIHSDLRQEARERALQRFREGKITVLCATEVAARGLDIDDVTHVVNFDCPDDEKMYLHRIGRTGRAGEAGVAITLAVWNELPRVEMIRRELDIDEEIHEVFSTSPLLDELFDLPAREEKSKVASPPQARSGKGSRSRKRAQKDDTRSKRSEKSDRSEKSSRSEKSDRSEKPSRSEKPDRSEKSSRSEKPDRSEKPSPSDDTDDDGIRQTRTRRRRRTRTKVVEGETVSEQTVGADAADDSDDASSDTSADRRNRSTTDRDDDSRTEGRTRTRTRTRSRSRSATTSTDDADAKDDAKDSDSKDSDSKDSDSKDSDSKDSDSKSRDSSSKRSKGGGSGGKDAQGDDSGSSSSRSRSRSGQQRSGKGRSSSGGDDSGSQGNGGSKNRKSGGGSKNRRDDDNGDGGRRGGRGNGRGRGSIDVSEARGEGTPRLNRKLEVSHLP